MTNSLISLLVLGLACSWFAAPAGATSIIGSMHDFTSSNSFTTGFGGAFLAPDENGTPQIIEQVCVFCHTPHQALAGAAAPLWNRTVSDRAYTFTPYSSSTLSVGPLGGPTGVSALCMSCHDGVTSVAVGTLLNPPGSGTPDQVTTMMATGAIGDAYWGDELTGGWKANIGNNYPGSGRFDIDLSNDHPISFTYPTNAPGIKAPADGRLRLFGTSKDRLECATCHLVHDRTYPPFLSMPNDASQMCLACHIK